MDDLSRETVSFDKLRIQFQKYFHPIVFGDLDTLWQEEDDDDV